jgi:hypothetical protein
MKRLTKPICLITISQVFWIIFVLFIIIIRSLNFGVWSNPEYDNVEQQGWRVFNVICYLFIPAAVIGYAGIIKRKNWARKLSIFAMGLTLLFIIHMVFFFIYWDITNKTSVRNFFIDGVAPWLLIAFLAALSIVALFNLNRPGFKEQLSSSIRVE